MENPKFRILTLTLPFARLAGLPERRPLLPNPFSSLHKGTILPFGYFQHAYRNQNLSMMT